MNSFADGVRLLADIGGTNARFALHMGPGRIEHVQVFACASQPSLSCAIRSYLHQPEIVAATGGPVRHAAVAIAFPVDGDEVAMTNHDWNFSTTEVRAALDLSTLLVVNDFAALAMALPHLSAGQRLRVGGGLELPWRPLGLVGPGTGLGVGAVVPCHGNWLPLASEGGHQSFAPATRDEARLLDALWGRWGHVSAERLLSGGGLAAIHLVQEREDCSPEQITERAAHGDFAARRTIEAFCNVLGSVAGNVALTMGATGGMFIGGGIVPRFGNLFLQSAFRQRFEDKGRMRTYLARIPTYLITDPYPALPGVAAMLDQRLSANH